MHGTRTIRWFTSLALSIVSIALSLFPAAQPVHADGPNIYYVSLTGSDTNPGTQTAPFGTFYKATSVLQPGDTLYIYGGTYTTRLKIAASGTSDAPIIVQPVPGERVIIDLLNRTDNNVSVTGSYVDVSRLDLRNSTGYCVNLQGKHNTFRGSVVHECYAAGIFTDGQDETIAGNTIYHGSKVNSRLNEASGWGSGIKVRVGGQNILIVRNKVYSNYGEGIAVTRGVNVTVRSNTVHDNYSANIYIDNSYNVVVEKNFIFNRPNNGFARNGNPADNIALGEENYGSWGARLSNITIRNNISYRGNHGVTFYGNDSGVPGGGLSNSIIAFNTLWGSVGTEINLAYDTGQLGNVIANNIVSQSGNKFIRLAKPAGVSFSSNFWVNALPPWYARTSGDKTGNVMLASTPSYIAGSFRPSALSPAIDAGSALSGVQDDYSGGYRPSGAAADMGAFEYLAP